MRDQPPKAPKCNLGRLSDGKLLHDRLWQEFLPISLKCFECSFIQEMARGTLSKRSYKQYIAQDIIFLCSYTAALTFAVSNVPMRGRVLKIIQRALANALLELQRKQIEGDSSALKVNAVRVLPTTARFADFVLRAAWSRRIEIVIASMAPCVLLYGWLGLELRKAIGETRGHPYVEWIKINGARDVQNQVREWKWLLDSVATESRMVRMSFRQALLHELSFFRSAYRYRT